MKNKPLDTGVPHALTADGIAAQEALGAPIRAQQGPMLVLLPSMPSAAAHSVQLYDTQTSQASALHLLESAKWVAGPTRTQGGAHEGHHGAKGGGGGGNSKRVVSRVPGYPVGFAGFHVRGTCPK